MPHATRTFRVFVSSTFSDLRAERDALQEHVFPALGRLCTEAGATFQPIDLRWGVSDEAGLDQQTMTICLTELKRCQDSELKPDFLILLGDRYGWEPLPPTIPADEYAQILAHTSDPARTLLLTQWYERDDNAAPPVHRLRARDSEAWEKADEVQRAALREAWEKEEAALRAALRAAIEEADLHGAAVIKYYASATEQEIIEGALDVPDAAEHVFCFARELDPEGLPKSVGPLPEKDPARAYRNFRDDGSLDDSAEVALIGLKSRLREKLGDHYVTYPAMWETGGEGGPGPPRNM